MLSLNFALTLLFTWQVVFGHAIRVTLNHKHIVPDSLVNIYLEYPESTYHGNWSIRSTYAYSDEEGTPSILPDTIIGDIVVSSDQRPKKLVWYVPANITVDLESPTVYISVYYENTKIASSKGYRVRSPSLKKIQGLPNWEHKFFDATKFYSDIKSGSIVVHSKRKKIGIVGAGISGLFSGFLLDAAGFHNYEIMEASDRLGGRINTSYFGEPNEYPYQEMGAMRVPVSYSHQNRTMPSKDHRIVFQVAEELNKRNDEKHHVKFVEWIQNNENALYYKDGIRLDNGEIPTIRDVTQNTSLKLDLGEDGRQMDAMLAHYMTDEWMDKMGADIYKAYQDSLTQGYDDWSEWNYARHYLSQTLNASALASFEAEEAVIWDNMYTAFVFQSTHWKTVDKGFSRLPNAFAPLLGDKIRFNTKVSKISFTTSDGGDDQIRLQWKSAPFDTTYQSETYDRVIIAAPFSVVRTWHLPKLSFTIDQAIKSLRFSQACKIALEFETRFWEHGDRPIFGGCSTTDMTTGRVCYPSYQLGAKGRGVMLASYESGDLAIRLAAMPEDEHVALVLENIVELHGQQAHEQFSGNYRRYCGTKDPYTAASWAEPLPGQHSLYIPAFFHIEQGLVFVGEHTDIKHAWVSAALDSAFRGVVMLLVEAGHVDDAKQLVQDWDISWIKV